MRALDLQWTRIATARLHYFSPLQGLVLLVAANRFFWLAAVYYWALDYVLYVYQFA